MFHNLYQFHILVKLQGKCQAKMPLGSIQAMLPYIFHLSARVDKLSKQGSVTGAIGPFQ